MHSSRNVTHALTYSFHKKFAKILCARTSNMIYFRNSLAFQLCRSHFFFIQGPNPKPVKINGNLSTFQWALDQSQSVLTRKIVPTSHWRSKIIHLSLYYINHYMQLPHRHELENRDLKSFVSLCSMQSIALYSQHNYSDKCQLLEFKEAFQSNSCTQQHFFSCIQKCKTSAAVTFLLKMDVLETSLVK